MKLLEVVENLDSYEPESTIFAKEPWSTDSEALVVQWVFGS